MLEIRVLGSGCPNCLPSEKMVFNVCAELDIEADIQKITDFNEFEKYGIAMTPGLIVNGKVISQGKIPTKSTLKQWIRQVIIEQK